MKGYVTLGLSVLAGAALLEAALIPGILIGGAAVLAPQYLAKLGRRPGQAPNSRSKRQPEARPPVEASVSVPPGPPASLKIKQAIAKTITFRIIVTTLDFTTNYVVIGEFAAAAGLSAFGLVAGPVFYLLHESAWNYFGPSGGTVDVPAVLRPRSGAKTSVADQPAFTIGRPLAKTITFRTIATVMDFTANFIVVRDLATAASLSAFAFVVGPFVYLGHEKIWDYYSSSGEGGEAAMGLSVDSLQVAHEGGGTSPNDA
jgi:uncharacterized membrane protein